MIEHGPLHSKMRRSSKDRGEDRFNDPDCSEKRARDSVRNARNARKQRRVRRAFEKVIPANAYSRADAQRERVQIKCSDFFAVSLV